MSRLERLQQLLAADPQDSEIHYMVAMEHKSAGQLDDALQKLNDCLDLSPQYAPAHYQKGSVLIAAGNIPQARETLTAGITAARQGGDDHAAEEMQELLNSLD